MITGTLDHLSRDQAAEAIRSLGGTFQTSVAKDTNYLIVGSSPGESKVAKARNLGTTMLDETAFRNLIGL